MTRSVHFTPAWDRRSDDPAKDYGVQGLNIILRLVDGDWATELILMTPWMLPAVQAWHKSMEPRVGAMVTPVCDVAVHHRNGSDAEQGRVVGVGDCEVFPEDACQNVPWGSLVGKRLYDLLVEIGEEPVWAELADIIAEARK